MASSPQPHATALPANGVPESKARQIIRQASKPSLQDPLQRRPLPAGRSQRSLIGPVHAETKDGASKDAAPESRTSAESKDGVDSDVAGSRPHTLLSGSNSDTNAKKDRQAHTAFVKALVLEQYGPDAIVFFSVRVFFKELLYHLLQPLVIPWVVWREGSHGLYNRQFIGTQAMVFVGTVVWMCVVACNVAYLGFGRRVLTDIELILVDLLFLARVVLISFKYAYFPPSWLSRYRKERVPLAQLAEHSLYYWIWMPRSIGVSETDYAMKRTGVFLDFTSMDFVFANTAIDIAHQRKRPLSAQSPRISPKHCAPSADQPVPSRSPPITLTTSSGVIKHAPAGGETEMMPINISASATKYQLSTVADGASPAADVALPQAMRSARVAPQEAHQDEVQAVRGLRIVASLGASQNMRHRICKAFEEFEYDGINKEHIARWRENLKAGRVNTRMLLLQLISDSRKYCRLDWMGVLVMLLALIQAAYPGLTRVARGLSFWGETTSEHVFTLCSVVATFVCSHGIFLFLYVGIVDYWRRLFWMNQLSAMLSPAFRGHRSHMHTKLMPPIGLQRPKNLLYWLYLRMVLKNFGYSYYKRLTATCSFIAFVSVALVVYVVVRSLQDSADNTEQTIASGLLFVVVVFIIAMTQLAAMNNAQSSEHVTILSRMMVWLTKSIHVDAKQTEIPTNELLDMKKSRHLLASIIRLIRSNHELDPVRIIGFEANSMFLRTLIVLALVALAFELRSLVQSN